MNTWAKDLNPTYSPMEPDATAAFVSLTLAEIKGEKELPEAFKDNLPFLSQIIQNRIDVIKLPIKFSPQAIIAVNCLCSVPGEAVALLVDCLNAFEGKEVTIEELSNLYPNGFYDKETFARYVDNYLKPKNVKWAEIY